MATVCNDLLDTVMEKAPLEEGSRALVSQLPIFAHLGATDTGPDHVAAKDMIANEIYPVLCPLLFSVNCHEQQAHLIVKDNFKMMQTVCDALCADAEVETVWYFSSLASTVNTWRFSLRATFMKWTGLHGLASSMLHASRQQPKCLSRRWVAADDAERFLLERPWEGMVVVLEEARCFKETAHKRMWSLGPLHVEGKLDATSCREKVVRWKRESLSAISHPVWQTMYFTMSGCRFVNSAGS